MTEEAVAATLFTQTVTGTGHKNKDETMEVSPVSMVRLHFYVPDMDTDTVFDGKVVQNKHVVIKRSHIVVHNIDRTTEMIYDLVPVGSYVANNGFSYNKTVNDEDYVEYGESINGDKLVFDTPTLMSDLKSLFTEFHEYYPNVEII